MLQRLLFLFVLLLIISISTNWLAQQPGEVSVDWFGWRMQLPTSLAVAFVFMFTLIVILFDRIWRFARDFPKWLTRRIKSRRDAAGHRALTLGLMAVSAGEVEAARKHASRAKRLLKSPELTGLLTAQVAHLTGDHRAAQNYFSSILGDRDTAFLGYVGLMRLELDRRDGVAALKAAKHALELNPASKMVARQLLQIEIEMRDWLAALKTLNVIRKAQKRRKKQRDKSELTLDRYEVVLNYLVSIEEINENKNYKIDRLKQALSVNPGFLPAAIELANFYIKTSEYSKATKVLETAFSFSFMLIVPYNLGLSQLWPKHSMILALFRLRQPRLRES